MTPEKSFAVTHPTDVFLVTLNKSDRDFSETTRYEDYSIDRMSLSLAKPKYDDTPFKDGAAL